MLKRFRALWNNATILPSYFGYSVENELAPAYTEMPSKIKVVKAMINTKITANGLGNFKRLKPDITGSKRTARNIATKNGRKMFLKR